MLLRERRKKHRNIAVYRNLSENPSCDAPVNGGMRCALFRLHRSIAFNLVEFHTRTRPQWMHRWCFFHNRMCIVHHHNWHLWYYNRFLLINWCMAHMKAVQTTNPNHGDRFWLPTASSSSDGGDVPRWKPHTVIFFMATYTVWLHHIEQTVLRIHCIHKLKLALEQLWNMCGVSCFGVVMLHYWGHNKLNEKLMYATEILIYFCILQNGLTFENEAVKANADYMCASECVCVCAEEWKIEVDIFNTSDIYWCIELNSEYVAIFHSLSSSLSPHHPDCARKMFYWAAVFLSSPKLLRWGKIINIETERRKNWFEILMCFGCTPYVHTVMCAAQ